MSNNYFQFKQFIVYQEHAAMKVTTDACVFGAWCCSKIHEIKNGNALDIGCGTGLLSLMLAQNFQIQIDAVDISEAAFIDAKRNFEENKIEKNIRAHHANIMDFVPNTLYDVILCNPPFFKSALNSPDANINLARHQNLFDLRELIEYIQKHLQNNGKAFMLMPFERKDETNHQIQQAGMHINTMMYLKHNAHKLPFRYLVMYSKNETIIEEETLLVRNTDEHYTEAFVQLMHPYYLHLKAGHL
jgi:tRNA1Val (adenine37-N6)-methyltransferase